MGYVEDLRKQVGNQPLILVRPSAAIINEFGQILLVKYHDDMNTIMSSSATFVLNLKGKSSRMVLKSLKRGFTACRKCLPVHNRIFGRN